MVKKGPCLSCAQLAVEAGAVASVWRPVTNVTRLGLGSMGGMNPVKPFASNEDFCFFELIQGKEELALLSEFIGLYKTTKTVTIVRQKEKNLRHCFEI